MLARVCSAAVNGIEAYPVEVEVNAGWGDTLIVIVGLPDAAVKESRDRVTTALTNSGFKFPMGRTTINLAPADVKKEGPSFDLPIALGMLAASEQIETDQLDNFVIVGELALTGAVRPLQRRFARGASRAGRRQNRRARSGGKRRRSRGGRRLAGHPGSKSARGGAISRRRNQNRADEGGHRQNFRPARTTTNWILPKSRARKTSSARWKSPPPAGTTCCSSARPAPANPCWPSGCRPFCRR